MVLLLTTDGNNHRKTALPSSRKAKKREAHLRFPFFILKQLP